MRSAETDHSREIAALDEASLCTGQSYLQRLGVLYMDQIRLNIVSELNHREMGIGEYFRAVEGSSYQSVRRHFIKLAEAGWLRRVRRASTSFGRPEDLYRATEPAVIDTETWGRIPISIRDALTVQLLVEMGGRFGEALQHGTTDGSDVVASFTASHLDERGWCEAVNAVERCFAMLSQEQHDAKIRIDSREGEPLSIVVSLGAFQLPDPDALSPKPSLPPADDPFRSQVWPLRIGKVFSDPLNLAIVKELNDGTWTATDLHERLGPPSPEAYLRRCKRLTDLGWVTVETRTGGRHRGANVFCFRATSPNISDSELVQAIPGSARTGATWDLFRDFSAASLSAVKAGIFNHRDDRHLSLSPLVVDEVGRAQVVEALEAYAVQLGAIKEAAQARHSANGSKRFRFGFLLSAIEAPARGLSA